MLEEYKMNKIKAISLFASAGIGELLIGETGIEIVGANELLPKRAACYSFFHPNTEMYCGDITEENTKENVLSMANKYEVEMLIATPPCQGFSTLGKNKIQTHYEKDRRNFLILEVFEIIDKYDFKYILIENVPKFLEMFFPYEGDSYQIKKILEMRYSDTYKIDVSVLNAKDYGVAQSRPRAIIKMYKKGLNWSWPNKQNEISLFDAIGHLPSLESGEASDFKWHCAKVQNERAVLALKHTPTGKSAITNEEYYPKKEDGRRIKGFHNTFKRMTWEQPCPARTTFSGSISSHNNVHPGRLQEDGTYSDARVLTLLETFIVSSIPGEIDFPLDSSETFIRTVIGESIPPKLMMEVLKNIER